MTIGFYLIVILVLGYCSVNLRERLNLAWLKPLTWLGIFIHESSHALACIITGGRVTGFQVNARAGAVSHYQAKVPVIGPMLIAIAPILGGLAAIGLLNHFWLQTSLGVSSASIWLTFLDVVRSFNFLTLSAWALIVLLLNVGVMLGPSVQDLKNIWPLVILSFFISSQAVAQILALVIVLIAINIILFFLIWLIKSLFKKPYAHYQRSN
ncbi:MAG TPA: hypothetical protein DEB69_02850 [Candidatus Komeilibacteria bacterium]|nr:hypothetical protein [Candidatus Komeilibacteria bacterium]